MCYRKELSQHLNTGTLTELHTCFSRDTEHINKSAAKYVTDLLTQQSKSISQMITDQSATIYVCGDARNMSKDVNRALTEILQTQNGN